MHRLGTHESEIDKRRSVVYVMVKKEHVVKGAPLEVNDQFYFRDNDMVLLEQMTETNSAEKTPRQSITIPCELFDHVGQVEELKTAQAHRRTAPFGTETEGIQIRMQRT